MPKYKVIFDGEEEDEVFDTREDAEEHALQLCGDCEAGAEVLHLSNPGDYPYDENTYEFPEYEIVEVDD